MKKDNERYLGDGLYASYDGYHIILRAPRSNGENHEVYLDNTVVGSLINYIEDIKKVNIIIEPKNTNYS